MSLWRTSPCEAGGFTVELGIYRLADVDLGGLDGDEAYEPRPLLRAPQVECQPTDDGTAETYHPNRRHVEESSDDPCSSFDASSAPGPAMRLYRTLRASVSRTRQVRPGKHTNATRSRDK